MRSTRLNREHTSFHREQSRERRTLKGASTGLEPTPVPFARGRNRSKLGPATLFVFNSQIPQFSSPHMTKRPASETDKTC